MAAMTATDTRPSKRFGVGLWWGLLSLAWFAPALAVHVVTWPAFVIEPLRSWAGRIAGGVLLAGGIAFYAWGRVHLHRAMRKGVLATAGPYRLVRHPLYAAGLWLMAPGVAVLAASWLLLPLPLWMALCLAPLLGREEAALASRFGDAWQAYAGRTGRLRPRFRSRRG